MVDKNHWGWKELDNMRVNADILQTLRGDNFVFRFFYDKRIINGDTASYFGKTPNRRVMYHDNIDYSDFKTSGTLQKDVPMIPFGCYGDVYSRDFGKLALNEPKQLEEFIEIHHDNAMNELNNDINRKFKEDIHDDANFTAHVQGAGVSGATGNAMIILNDRKFYQSGTTMGKDNAEEVWESIYANAFRLCRRSNRYNVKGVISNIASLKDIIILYTPKIHAMIQNKLYAGTPHPERLHFEPMFGGVGITDFSDHAFSTDIPAGRTLAGAFGQQTVAGAYSEGEYGAWYDSKDHIVMLGKDSYKICDAINPPLYVDNSRLGMSLKTYFFKWFFGFAGFIDFVNALKWQERPTTTTNP